MKYIATKVQGVNIIVSCMLSNLTAQILQVLLSVLALRT